MANLSSVARSAYSDLLRLLKDDMITNVRGSLMTKERGGKVYWYAAEKIGNAVKFWCQRRRQNRPRGGAKVGQWRGTKRHGACAPQIAGACHGALARRASSARCDQVAAWAFRARLWLRR